MDHIRLAILSVDDDDLMDDALADLDQLESLLVEFLQENGRLQTRLADALLKTEVQQTYMAE